MLEKQKVSRCVSKAHNKATILNWIVEWPYIPTYDYLETFVWSKPLGVLPGGIRSQQSTKLRATLQLYMTIYIWILKPIKTFISLSSHRPQIHSRGKPTKTKKKNHMGIMCYFHHAL